MRTLQLCNNINASFFQQQVSVLEDAGVSCDVLSVPGERTKREDVVEGRTPFDYLKFVSRVRRTVSSEYDLIHANNGLTLHAALAQRELPIVVTFYGSELMGRFGPVMSTLAKFADGVILPSPVMTGYVDCDYLTIPYGIDTDLFQPMPQAEAREYVGWNQDETVVLFPYSRGRGVKNYPLASDIVQEASVDARLKTVYDADYEEMPYYMNASDTLLVTSDRESGPMVVKEAVACNLPVVSRDVGFVSEVLCELRSSYVCESRQQLVDSLEAVLESNRSSNRRQYSEDWSLARMGERITHLYESL